MDKKVKITFVVPELLQNELRRQVIHDGYGMRGKSKWVTEAVQQLLDHADYVSLSYLSDEMNGFDKTETITVDEELKNKLEKAILETRKHYPMLEGVQSRLLRTSIMQRILRSSNVT